VPGLAPGQQASVIHQDVDAPVPVLDGARAARDLGLVGRVACHRARGAAGLLSGREPWHSLPRRELERFLQVNFVGYFLVAQAFYPLLKKSKAGRIINVASRTFFLANPGQMAYVASKGAVWGMTRVLARECGDDNITVNAVAPGMIATPGTMAHSKEEAFERVMQNQAIKKRGKPEHLANLIAFLASDEAEMITGQFMLADGGGYLH